MIIAQCIYATEANNKLPIVKECLASLLDTVDLSKNRLIIINNSCNLQTEDFLTLWQKGQKGNITVFTPKENMGTARGINLAINCREPGEVVIKTDDDVKWHPAGWVEQLESVFTERADIGICGLKRADIEQNPNHDNPNYRTSIEELPNGLDIEICRDIIGTCTAFNPAMLDKIGYMNQPSDLYGFDDALFSVRSLAAGFTNCFLPQIKITNLDTAATEYTEWKKKEAGLYLNTVSTMCEMYKNGKLNYYYDGGFTN